MAITYGMSVKSFWEDNPDLFWAYRFSYFDKMRLDSEIFNSRAWLQGAYFHEAVSVALCNAFSKTKVNYAQVPYGVKMSNRDSKANIEVQVADLKARISQVNKIKCSTTKKGKPER